MVKGIVLNREPELLYPSYIRCKDFPNLNKGILRNTSYCCVNVSKIFIFFIKATISTTINCYLFNSKVSQIIRPSLEEKNDEIRYNIFLFSHIEIYNYNLPTIEKQDLKYYKGKIDNNISQRAFTSCVNIYRVALPISTRMRERKTHC